MSIDEILEQQVYPYYELQYHDEAKEHIKYIKQALYKDMVELIGEDEEYDEVAAYNGNTQACIRVGRNALRQELRTKLREYFGVKE